MGEAGGAWGERRAMAGGGESPGPHLPYLTRRRAAGAALAGCAAAVAGSGSFLLHLLLRTGRSAEARQAVHERLCRE